MAVTHHEPEPGLRFGLLRNALHVDSAQWARILLLQLLLATLLLRLFWLSQPPGSLVFDEAYYVNAGRVILGWAVPEGGHYATAEPGIDPNTEHLPLAKLIIAGSMRQFGDNAFGWRLPSVLFGTAVVGLLYLLVNRMTRRPWLGLLAAFVLSFDNLVFVHGRIATLDIFMLAFMLLGLYWYVDGRPGLAGAAIALAALSKINGIYGIGAIVAFEVLRFAMRADCRPRALRTLADLLVVVGAFIVVLLGVLWPIDRLWTRYETPIDHVAHVYSYGLALRHDSPPQGIESRPWQWLVNKEEITYLKQEVTVMVDGQTVSRRPTVEFVGAMNIFVIAMLPLALTYLVYGAVQKREDFPLFMLVLLAATYLPPLAAAVLVQRISYIFYMLPVLPALAAGIAYLLLDLKLPRVLPLAYAASVLFGFIAMFPFRTWM